MVRKFTYIFFSLAILFIFDINTVLAQENVYENLLKEEVEVLNPVYKPVIGVGTGVLNYIGEVHNNIHNSVVGRQNTGYKIDVTTFIDNKNRYFNANFYLLLGNLNGNERNYTDPNRNLNFSTDIYDFGINVIYNFGHFISKKSLITPFIGLGLEDFQFNSKTDLHDSQGRKYYYWTDGTIRDIDQSLAGTQTSNILHRDYTYETDIKDLKRFGLSNYSQNALAIPIDLGLKFNISSRMYMKLGTSLHYTFTDNIDGVSYEGKERTGNKMNDMFTYSYVSFHFDLFSSPKTVTFEKLFADVDFDYAMFEDEDNDMVFDPVDKCPHTPFGVEVDSTGCPLDADKDGVPDYLDKQPHSNPNAIVDENGIEISPDHLALALDTAQAIKREDVEAYLQTILGAAKYYKKHGSVTIPEKFKALDTNHDGYISYEELLKTINDYFDFKNNMSNKDIGELTDFFFTQ
ncbi:MAG: DUF6089 family protein [Bacteroidota bacterium]|nr:DUF6089 family protein [Bacteroidota bacterium]